MTAPTTRVSTDASTAVDVQDRLGAFVASGWAVAGVAFLAAAPTLLRAATHPVFMADDWVFAAAARYRGVSGFLHGIDVKSRPVQATYHAATFLTFRGHVVAHLLLLAALAAIAGALVLVIARSQFSARVALLVSASWLVLANHGATHFWISTSSILVALVLLLLAAKLVLVDCVHPAWPTLLVVLSALSYEGGLALGAGIVAVAWWRCAGRSPRRRWFGAAASGLALVVTAGWVAAFSPKGAPTGSPTPPSRLLASGLGSALLPEQLRSWSVVPFLLVLLVGVSVALPAFRRSESVKLFVSGVVVLILGALPFLAVGFPISTDGMLDRGNTFLSLGTALLVACVLDQFWRLPAPVAPVLALASLAVLASANVQDFDSSRQAGKDGIRALDQLEQLAPGTWSQSVKLAPMPNRGGWSMFGYDSVRSALWLRTGRLRPISDSVDEAEFDRSNAPVKLRFDGTNLQVVRGRVDVDSSN